MISCSNSDSEDINTTAIQIDYIDKTLIAEDNPRKTFARLSASSTKTQILNASSQSNLGGVIVSFPPGCLTTSSDTTEVSLEEGVDKYFETGVADFTQISSGKILEHEASMLLKSPDDSLDFSCEFNIEFPINKTTNLHLTEIKNIVLFYHIFDKNTGAYRSGFKNIDSLDGIVQIKTNRLVPISYYILAKH